MLQSPSWAANWFAASQEIPRISRNPKVHYRTYKRPPPVSILGPPNPVHITTSHLLEIHPNIINPSTPRSPRWSLSLRFPHQDPIHTPLLTHTRHMPCPSHSSRFYHPHNIEWGVQIISSSLCSLLHSPVTSSLLGPNILLNTIFSNTLSFLSSLNVSDQVSHPYKTTGKIIVLYILIFKFLGSNWEIKGSALNDSKHFLKSICTRYIIFLKILEFIFRTVGKTCMTYTYCCVYSTRRLVMDRRPARNI